ncbi:MAG: oxaloacetate decarboxylase subunit alpha, partial [Candidatus Hydrogenedens sp.]|nr:oxaloacetate decarboxylase subunit alpha [Candidatus Hydrogenedens sp.]
THNTTGTGDMVNLKAIEAGVDIVDCALSPLGNGTSQPATESLIATLQGTEYDTGIDLNELTKATDHFRGVAQKLKEQGILDPKVLSVDVNTLKYQVPGGMLSNLINQLKQAGQSDKLYEVLAEVPRVRKDFGYPPLVTPTSQIVGTQAVMNVITGERYKMNPKESQGLMAGEYGTLPAPVNEEVRKKVIGDRPVITCRPVEDPNYGVKHLDEFRKEIGQYYTQEEDVLSYALFPQVATKFFEKRLAQTVKLDTSVLDKANNAMPV